MPALADALDRLDRDRQAVLAALDAMTPAQRAFRPAADAWSADDVADHLAKAETGLLSIVEGQVAAGDARRDLGKPSWVKQKMVEAFMRSNRRVKMPSAVVDRVAPTGAPFAESRAALAACGDRWHALAAAFPTALESVGVFAHPVAGPLSASGSARFAGSHLDHHLRQLIRIRAAAGFPSI